MQDYFAETDPHKRDAIAARQLSVLGNYQDPRHGRLRLGDIKAMFDQMKGLRIRDACRLKVNARAMW